MIYAFFDTNVGFFQGAYVASDAQLALHQCRQDIGESQEPLMVAEIDEAQLTALLEWAEIGFQNFDDFLNEIVDIVYKSTWSIQ